jgi:hypothetical protein
MRAAITPRADYNGRLRFEEFGASSRRPPDKGSAQAFSRVFGDHRIPGCFIRFYPPFVSAFYSAASPRPRSLQRL